MNLAASSATLLSLLIHIAVGEEMGGTLGVPGLNSDVPSQESTDAGEIREGKKPVTIMPAVV